LSLLPSLVLVHGAGHTSRVWKPVQLHLRHPSVAIDLPGRRDRPGDITSTTIDEAARRAADDVEAATTSPVILVGHSAGGIVLPALAARLDGRVEHLVFVAGLCAREGNLAAETFATDTSDHLVLRLRELRVRYGGHMFAGDRADRSGLQIDDPKLAMALDSMNYTTQRVSWAGVSPGLGRTFVRCLRDALQSREVQARLIADCGASQVIDLDVGHNAPIEDPRGVAAVLDRIADEHPGDRRAG
jgi:pimeloyl-ACP methyl ester carboxylesterase